MWLKHLGVAYSGYDIFLSGPPPSQKNFILQISNDNIWSVGLGHVEAELAKCFAPAVG